MERSSPTKPDRRVKARRPAATLVCVSCQLSVVSFVWLLGTTTQAAPPDVYPGSIASAAAERRRDLNVRVDGTRHSLGLPDTAPFHTTERPITDARLIDLPGSSIRLAVWRERVDGRDGVVPFYAISFDGRQFTRARRTSYEIKLKTGDFDPLRGAPNVAPALTADADSHLFIVQFWTQPLEEFRRQLRALGGKVRHYLPLHAHLVEMSAAARLQVETLPYVRWVGPFHPAYRLEPALWNTFNGFSEASPPQRYNVMVLERGLRQQEIVADRIAAKGGTVGTLSPRGFRLEATLTPRQLLHVVRMDEVLFIDRWSPPQPAMDIARQIGGADYVESVAGYTGAGVRAEIMDQNLDEAHPDFAATPPIFHGPRTGPTSHGMATYGICFGDGTGFANARGMLPDAQGIFADFTELTDRYQHTVELLADPYFAVLQSNSWGTSSIPPQGYSTVSAELDDIVFLNDVLVLHSMGNGGSAGSPFEQAWAKNVVSVGGVFHQNTLTKDDDCWCEGGVPGPAPDGRIKPDLVHFYDQVLTTAPNDGYVIFGGTSAAASITAGYAGLFFQMWSDGIFGNPVDPGGTVFENRPHAATARAVLINTASAYPFSGTGDDLTRMHQGWGMPDLQRLYEQRDRMLIVDQTDVLANLGSTQYQVEVQPGEPAQRVSTALRATLVYTDPAGIPSSEMNRVNDLTLKVVSPSDTVYWGNHGLLEGNESLPDGEADTLNPVENVFIENPQAGTWLVEVYADEINADGHPETPELDADYALVVSGVAVGLPGDLDGDGDVDVDDFAALADCLNGPDNSPAPACSPDTDADLDADGDVDVKDFATFTQHFTGSG